MTGTITKDPTNQNFWLVVTAEAAFGLRLKKGVAALLKKLKGDVLVEIDRDVVTVGGHHIGQIIGWNGEPCSPSSDAAWTLVTESGRPGRLGRALKKAVEDGRITAEEAAAWVRRYLGPKSVQQLLQLLDSKNSSSSDDELLQILKQHIVGDHGEEGDLPPW